MVFYQESLRGERVFRPTEEAAIRNIDREQKLWSSAKWRLDKFGCVRLTSLERQAMDLERQAIKRHYRTRKEIKEFVADSMQISIREVERKLAKASRILELLEKYPALGRKSEEQGIIEVIQFPTKTETIREKAA